MEERSGGRSAPAFPRRGRPAPRGRAWRRVSLSTLAVATAGALLHFAWDWSGGSPLVAVFAAVNESTWEHLKMAFWPALLLAPVQRRLYGRPPGWLPATAVRALLPPVLITAGFYGYTGVLGTNLLALDIGLFVAAVFVGELAGHAVMGRRAGRAARAAAAAALAAAAVAFSTLSSSPPPGFLFEVPHRDAHERPAAGASTSPVPRGWRGSRAALSSGAGDAPHVAPRRMTPADPISTVLPEDLPRLAEVWEASVRATHHFVSEEDVRRFKTLVPRVFLQAGRLDCVRDEAGRVAGFVGVTGDEIEMLFVHPGWRGKGIGRRLLEHAVDHLGATRLDVNEQNEQAVGFYRRMGFEVVGRSERDGLGKPYPLLHMRRPAGPAAGQVPAP